LEGVVCAIKGEQRERPPQPGQELVESVWFRELVPENGLEQFERA
jgi:hypothetical protein